MTKRLFALFLCLLMCASCMMGCVLEEKEEVVLTPEEEELLKGAQINMYLGEMIYDFDPANAYHNEAAMKLISLMYEPLFYLNENGKLKSNLVKKYEILEDEEEEEYMMILTLADDAYWSDGTYVSANDVVFTWKRLLEAEASYEAAALLFDIKNARRANQGDTSIDNIGLSAPSDKRVEIIFEGPIDYEHFLLNLTSYSLAPLRENYATKTSFYVDMTFAETPDDGVIVRKYDDWAKKSATMASSGPFKIRTIVYPDDPAKDEVGNFLRDAEGNFLFYRYAPDAIDGVTLVPLTKGTYYETDANGEIRAYSLSYLTELQNEDPLRYAELITTLNRIEGVESDYALEPQNTPRIVMERNPYYYKNMDADNWKVDKNVKPYRLIVDYSLSDEELLQAFENGEIFYVGDIPMSVRSDYADKANVTDGLSTHSYYMNANAVVNYSHIELDAAGLPILFDKKGTQITINPLSGAPLWNDVTTGRPISYVLDADENGRPIYLTSDGTQVFSNANTTPILGEKILANADLRTALSLVIDRQAIAEAIVFAEAATALVPTGVFDTNSAKLTFRENGKDYISSSANKDEALAKLASSGIDPTKFVLKLSYAEYDEVHEYIAKTVAAAWESIGFTVQLDALRTIENEDMWTTTQEKLTEVKDDLWLESLVSGNYQIMAMDMVAISADPFSVLAPFATLFSGMGMDMRNFNEYGEQQYVPATHATGFSDATYDQMIEDIFAEKDIKKRSEALHAAEEYLMNALPVIPIVYNQNAVLVNDDMLTDATGNYYAPAGFVNTYLKGSDQYNTRNKTIMITTIIIAAVVLVLAAIITFTVIYRIKKKKREEEIARISAEQEAKLREIRRPGSSR